MVQLLLPKQALEMLNKFICCLWWSLHELLPRTTTLLLPEVPLRTAVQKDAQRSPTVMQVITVMSSPVTNDPSSQPLNLVHECFRCIGFMRLINRYALGSSLNTSRKGFISLFPCLRIVLRNHRGRFYEGLGQAHKSNEVLQVTFSRAVWMGSLSGWGFSDHIAASS